jgi:hypothetical protein
LDICDISVHFFIISPLSFRAKNNPDHHKDAQQLNIQKKLWGWLAPTLNLPYLVVIPPDIAG